VIHLGITILIKTQQMKRQIIEIDEQLCDGCGLCVPECHEGALQIIDGKARLISDLFCDGLGACIGHCPQGAMEIIEREAEEYDERKVLEGMVPKGINTIKAHLKHLKDHGADTFLAEAHTYLKEKGIDLGEEETHPAEVACGCAGMQHQAFGQDKAYEHPPHNGGPIPTSLRQWPVQLHLLNPAAPFLRNADLLMAADCTAFAMGGFHPEMLKERALAIACPKLDSNKDIYVDKLARMIDDSMLNTIEVAIMEVPCCGGLVHLVNMARQKAERNIPVKQTVVSIRGEILQSEWV